MIKFTVVTPKQTTDQIIDRINREAEAAVKKSGLIIVRKADGVADSWSAENTPDWDVEVSRGNKGAKASVSRDGEPAESATLTVWELLDKGTATRFMGLSSDWISKTSPGSLQSGTGQGHTTGLSKLDKGGIEARSFEDQIWQEVAPEIDKIVESAIDELIFRAQN